MNIAEKLNNSDHPLFTFELLPPLKGRGIDAIYDTIDNLLEFNPSYINITSHAADIVYKNMPDGSISKMVVRKRPGSVATAAAIKYKYNIEVVPHIICSGLNREEIENLLIDLNFLDINNIFVLRGDPQKGSRIFIPKEDGHDHTTSLMQQVNMMNSAKYLDDSLKNPKATQFSMGVACYPEKHIEAPNLTTDIQYLKEKVNLGAGYAVTQMFFDNQKYKDFVKSCRASGINIPIVPGIKPIAALNDISLLPQIFNIDLPEDLVKEIQKCKTKEQVRELGVEWSIAQAKDLLAFGVPSLHFYSLGESDNLKKICKAVF
ncbi:MAG: 5,10-methylenetetrahydrofolate reductase [Bacteroidetes bacterium ADurb.Bin302]|nr:MAG: 5,10-methylenetetrahydrofolate reductase [Bacteroidetes bacterium ADurb.Bin302]